MIFAKQLAYTLSLIGIVTMRGSSAGGRRRICRAGAGHPKGQGSQNAS